MTHHVPLIHALLAALLLSASCAAAARRLQSCAKPGEPCRTTADCCAPAQCEPDGPGLLCVHACAGEMAPCEQDSDCCSGMCEHIISDDGVSGLLCL